MWRFSFCNIESNTDSPRVTENVSVNTDAVLSLQISQVCQLCQQSPRLFTNHAAQLHTLLVSIFSRRTLCPLCVQLCVCREESKETVKNESRVK